MKINPDSDIQKSKTAFHLSDELLVNETVAAINRGEAQIDAGEGIDFDQFAAEMRKKIALR